MALNISTNTAAHRAGATLSLNQSRLQRAFDRISSGKKISTPVEDPGSLAVSMKLEAAINRLTGAQNNVKNAISFLEVQDGLLDSVGKIVDRMSELKGLASQDPMKSEQDRASYNNEFKDLQVQLHDISQMKFNGVSLFANFTVDQDESLMSSDFSSYWGSFARTGNVNTDDNVRPYWPLFNSSSRLNMRMGIPRLVESTKTGQQGPGVLPHTEGVCEFFDSVVGYNH